MQFIVAIVFLVCLMNAPYKTDVIASLTNEISKR